MRSGGLAQSGFNKERYNIRESVSMFPHAPEEVHDKVHRSAVVELLLELHALPRHLDAHEHVQQTRH